MGIPVLLVDGSTFFDDFINFELADSDGVGIGGGCALAAYRASRDGIGYLFGVGVDRQERRGWIMSVR